MRLNEAHIIAYAASDEMRIIREQTCQWAMSLLAEWRGIERRQLILDVDDTCLDTLEYVQQLSADDFPAGWKDYIYQWHRATPIEPVRDLALWAVSAGYHVVFASRREPETEWHTYQALNHAGFPMHSQLTRVLCSGGGARTKAEAIREAGSTQCPMMMIDDNLEDLRAYAELCGDQRICSILLPNNIYGLWSKQFALAAGKGA